MQYAVGTGQEAPTFYENLRRVLQDEVEKWRADISPQVDSEEWEILIYGGRAGSRDVIRAVQIMPREKPTAEALTRITEVIEGIGAGPLIGPDDPNYPKRPQRDRDA